MFRQFVSVVLSVSLLLFAYGCSSTRAVSVDQFQKNPNMGIEKVVLKDGSVVEFDVANGKVGVYRDGEVAGYVKDGTMRHIPASDIQSVYYTEGDTGKSAMLGGGILIGLVVVGAVVVVVALLNTIGDIGGGKK